MTSKNKERPVEAAAVLFLIEESFEGRLPTPSEVAKTIGCSRASLYKMATFMKLHESLASMYWQVADDFPRQGDYDAGAFKEGYRTIRPKPLTSRKDGAAS